MRTKLIAITALAIPGALAAILTAPVASAADVQSCTAQITSSLCQRPGNAQVQSTPAAAPSGDFSSHGPFFSYDRGFGQR
jgi:hypothetical protein